jgi:hypothetical protein
MSDQESPKQQSEKYFARQFDVQLPPFDYYQSHGPLPPSKDRLGATHPEAFRFSRRNF